MLPNSRRVAILRLRFANGNCLSLWFAFFGFLVISGCHRKSPEVVSIGHIASFRGPAKLSGEHAKQGIQLALQEVQGDEGTVQDRRIEVIHVDSGGDPKAVEAATVRLAVINRVVAFLSGTDSAQSATMEGVARNNEIPLVTSGGLPGRGTADFVFRTGLSPEAQAKKLAEYASQHQTPPIRKIAVLANGTDQGPSSFLADQFSKEFLSQKEKGNSLAGTWTYQKYRKNTAGSEGEWEFKSAEDLKEIMDQIRKSKPDAIFLSGAASDLPPLQKSGLDQSLPLFFAGEEGSEPILRATAGSQPVYLVTAFALMGDALQRDFVTQYEKQFQEPPDVHAALAYDNMRILIDALKRASSPKPIKIKEALEDMKDFQTLTGPASFCKEGHWLDREPFVVKVLDGQSKVVWPVGH
jgi:branched-chain amino acid transport system substrate-binding protein